MPVSVRLLGFCIGALGLTVAALTIAPRLAYPWPIEWMEGASLHHVLRMSQGQALYVAPSAEFVPYLYPPLSYLPMALAVYVLGPSLWAGRLVSVLAFAGTSFCMYRIVARESGSAAVGCSAAGLFALGFGYTGAFLDLVRVDSVFILAVLLGLERLSARDVPTGFTWLAISCFAKQHGMIFLGAAWLASIVALGPKRALRPVVASALIVAIGVVAFDRTSDGWFLRYTWSVPGGHGLLPHLLASYFGIDVLVYLPALAVFTVFGLIRERGRTPWLALLAAGLCASALGRAHPGGDDNVRLPGFALLVITGTLAYARLWSSASRPAARHALSAALLLQALWLLQLPAAHAPKPAHARALSSLLAALDRCAGDADGPGVALDHALLTRRPFVHTMALSDLHASGDPALGNAADEALVAALAAPTGPPSLAMSVSFAELDRALGAYYEPCETIPPLAMPTGYSLEPTRVFRRREGQVAGAGLLWR